MNDRLDDVQRKLLHSKDYVEKFERWQSPGRLRRLIDLLDLDKDFDIADFGCGSGMILEYLSGISWSDAGPTRCAQSLRR